MKFDYQWMCSENHIQNYSEIDHVLLFTDNVRQNISSVET